MRLTTRPERTGCAGSAAESMTAVKARERGRHGPMASRATTPAWADGDRPGAVSYPPLTLPTIDLYQLSLDGKPGPVPDGLTAREAAQLLHVPVSSVKTRLYRAKAHLRAALAEGPS